MAAFRIEWGIPEYEETGIIPEFAPVYEHLVYFFNLGNQSVTTNNGGIEIIYRKVEE